MADVEIKYKGANISTMSTSVTKTLNIANKYCEDNITVTYDAPMAHIATKSVTATSVTQLVFQSLNGLPVDFSVRLVSGSISPPTSGTNYYITAIHGKNTATTTYATSSTIKTGNYSGSLLSCTVSSGTISFKTTATLTQAPGRFITNGKYQLIYTYIT